MEVIGAIYNRRAVRSYTSEHVDRSAAMTLIQAAAQAPSYLNAQPWAFAVIEGAERLKAYSERAKAYFLPAVRAETDLSRVRHLLTEPDYNIFHDAPMLIVICAKPIGSTSHEDCFLAAQNLMLAACDLGLGTCPVSFSRLWLSLLEVKHELRIPDHYTPVFPVVVGKPRGVTPPSERHEPEIVVWE